MFRGQNLTELCLWITEAKEWCARSMCWRRKAHTKDDGHTISCGTIRVNDKMYSGDENALIALHSCAPNWARQSRPKKQGLAAFAGIGRAF